MQPELSPFLLFLAWRLLSLSLSNQRNIALNQTPNHQTYKKAVLLVGNFLSESGFNRAVTEDLAEQLCAAGWQVSTTSHRVNRLGRLLDMVMTVWIQRHNYQVAQVDIFSGMAFRWAEAVIWLLRRLSKPYVLTLHGGGLPDFAVSHPKRVGNLLKHAKVVTTPSVYLKEKMQPYYHGELRVLPNPLEISFYAYRQRVKPKPTLIWLRAFHQMYNPMLALKVLEKLAQDIPNVTLTMIGPDKGDNSREAVEQMAKDLGIYEHLELVGGVPRHEVPKLLAQGDIFLNTTRIDNTPISVIEAMACGLCVISTAVGGIPYLLTDEIDALLTPADDSNQMVKAVKRILDEPNLAEKLSDAGRKKAEQFDWSVVLPQWENLLEEVITK
ncbi:MAG: glycosyltransferase family 4 protein [Chloroflexi bacterium]|nr:glycosyltransferase family 4 protein [Chloroflexota bacterium]